MRTSPVSEPDTDLGEALAAQVVDAAVRGQPLRIVGGDTRAFYGRRVEGEVLALAAHRGVVAYEPSELVITARAGTPLIEIEALLAANGQMLAFESPVFGPSSTLGGAVASGLCGPRRPFAGAVRDSVLGAKVLDGRGAALRFGGTVFKNVAGFDAFRLMAGALGCLGVLLEVSIRVAPRPRREVSLALELASEPARRRVTELTRRPLAISGAFHDGERLHLRLSGGEGAVDQAARDLGGEAEPIGFWDGVRHMTHPRFADVLPLWRISVPQSAALNGLPDDAFWDWGGAHRWVAGELDETRLRDAARAVGGHVTQFRGAPEGGEVFEPLPAPLFELHRRIKAALDPAGVFNPGRMYEGL